MRGVYTVATKLAGINSARTLLYLVAPATSVVELLSVTVTNENNATNFQFEISIAKISSLGSPTATTQTPTPHEFGDQAALSTVKTNVTASEPTYGYTNTQEGAASLIGYRHEPNVEERIYVAPTNAIGVRLITTPSSTDFDIRFTFREIG